MYCRFFKKPDQPEKHKLVNKSEIERQNTEKAAAQDFVTPIDEVWEVVDYKHENRIARTQELVEKVRQILATAREECVANMQKGKESRLTKLTLEQATEQS